MGNATATAAGEAEMTMPDHQPQMWKASTASCGRNCRGGNSGSGGRGRGRTWVAANDSSRTPPLLSSRISAYETVYPARRPSPLEGE
jgi:hypothetical protein